MRTTFGAEKMNIDDGLADLEKLLSEEPVPFTDPEKMDEN